MSKPVDSRELYGKAIGVGLMGLAALAADGLLAAPAHAGVNSVGGWDLGLQKKLFAPDLYSGANVGVYVATGDFAGDGTTQIVTGNGPGIDASLTYLKWNTTDLAVTNAADIQNAGDPQAGIRVAAADLDGDGFTDVITGAASGSSSALNIWQKDHLTLSSAYSYPQTNGIYVAAGDVDGDGVPDIITGPSTGDSSSGAVQSPVVNVFNYDSVQQKMKFRSSLTPYDKYSGGVRVAAGDVNGDGFADIVTAPDQGTNPLVEIFNYDKSSAQLYDKYSSFTADSSGSSQGVFVAVGDVDGDGFDDIITGAGPGGLPMVNVYSYSKPLQDWVDIDSFQAYDSSYLGGVSVSVGDLNGDGIPDIITARASADVPEPGSVAILTVGCTLLARRRRRRPAAG